MDQFLHSGERFAGADNIIDNDHTLAFDKLGILAVEVQRLHLGRSNGMYFNADGVGHVGFDALACDKMLLFAGLARHFVDKTDGLGFGCDKIVVRRKNLVKLSCAGFGKLIVAEHDKAGNRKFVVQSADRQVAFKTGHFYLIVFLLFVTHITSLFL